MGRRRDREQQEELFYSAEQVEAVEQMKAEIAYRVAHAQLAGLIGKD